MSEYHWHAHLPVSEQIRDSHEAQNPHKRLINNRIIQKNQYYMYDQSIRKKLPKWELDSYLTYKILLQNAANEL